MCQYDGKIKTDPTSIQAGFRRNCDLRLGTLSWIVSQLDCKRKLEFLQFLTLKYPRKLGELARFFLVVREPRKHLGKKVVRNSGIFPRKCRNFFGGPRTETKFVKWSASRKRLRTAELESKVLKMARQLWNTDNSARDET